jgi:hypothetical protein
MGQVQQGLWAMGQVLVQPTAPAVLCLQGLAVGILCVWASLAASTARRARPTGCAATRCWRHLPGLHPPGGGRWVAAASVCVGGAHGPCVHRVRHDFGCLQTGLRSWCSVGLTRSLNSKKSSPNRVCCNALLAAYAICPGRATPPRWRQVGDLCCFCVCVGGGGVGDMARVCTMLT